MITNQTLCEIEVVGSDDGKETFEVRRKWNENLNRLIVIELYPTITADNPMTMDTSTMHLLNHAEELGCGELRIVNLYSSVFRKKPTVSELVRSETNIQYIASVFDSNGIEDCKIVIAWGNSLMSHAGTNLLKAEILDMILKRGLADNVKQIGTDNLNTISQMGTHPLFLGLRFNSDIWYLEPYPIAIAKESLTAEKPADNEKTEDKKEGRKGKKDVLQDKKSA